MQHMLNRLYSLFFIALIFASCQQKNGEIKTKKQDDGRTYFSVKQYIHDQWTIYKDQPFGFNKFVYLNGKMDSSLVNVDQVDWGAIIKPFFDADIGDKKFLGQYTFTAFQDQTTQTVNFYYEAKNDKLFTRKFQIMADDVTAKVRSIYIETERNSRGSHFTQKLFYIPLKVISIQEFDHSTPGPAKELRVEYRFL